MDRRIVNKRIMVELLLFYILLVFLLPNRGHGFDTDCWKNWALYINSHGLGNVYNGDASYPPLIMYFLFVYDFIQGTDVKIAENIHYFKALPLLFDFLPIILLMFLKKNYELSKGYYFFLLFNIAYLYNTMLWGQVDSIHTNLILTSIFLCFNFPVLAMMVFVLALNMKLQSIIFLPIFLICLVTYIKSTKDFIKCLTLGFLVQMIILIPFFFSNTLTQLLTVVTSSTSYFPFASMNAFNFWHLVLDGNPMDINDDVTFLNFSYKSIGLTLFLIFSAIGLFPLVIKSIRMKISGSYSSDFQELIFLTTGVIALVFFFFNTQMHERYSHPALIFMFFYSVYRRKFVLFILVSIAYFLNMEKVLKFYDIAYNTLIFETKFVASLFLITMILGLVYSYKNYNISDDIAFLKNAFLNSKKNDKTIKEH